jgi:Galactose oxidase, central domain
MSTLGSGARLGRAASAALLACAAAAGLAGTPAQAAGAATVPPGRTWPSVAYDPPRHELVLFGGNDENTVYGDTWTWKDSTWTEQDPARSPSARVGAAMVYDPATQQLLLFGGSSRPGTEGGYKGGTWVWTGRSWLLLHPATSPSPRHNADMIYDAATQSVILFGGYDGHYLGDTWSWNGTTWTQLSPATSPSPRDGESFVYDPATQTGILYGGFNDSRLSDTWSWNGTTWTELYPTTSPGVVTTAWQGAYDTASGQVLLFGGDPGDGNPPQNLTWTWTGTTWSQLSPATSPPGRVYGSMTYDPVLQRVVLLGGATNGSETEYPTAAWIWKNGTWARRQ